MQSLYGSFTATIDLLPISYQEKCKLLMILENNIQLFRIEEYQKKLHQELHLKSPPKSTLVQETLKKIFNNDKRVYYSIYEQQL